MTTRNRRPTVAQLTERVNELESANTELAAELDSAKLAPAKPSRGRTALAVVAILLASLLMPVAIVTSWFSLTVVDTDRFVAAYSPLIADSRVQSYLTDQLSTAISDRMGIDSLVDQAISGLSDAAQRPVTKAALDALRQPMIAGIRSTIRSTTADVVASDAFATTWRESLRLSHSELTGALAGDPSNLVVLDRDGIGLRLGPMVDRVRDALVARGFTLASRIPSIDQTVTIFASDSVVATQLAYRAALVAGIWLLPVALLLAALGVLAARRRALATVWAAVGLGLGTAVVLAGVMIGRVIVQLGGQLPPGVLLLFYDTTFAALREAALGGVTLAAVVGVVAWLSGPFGPAVKLRGFASGATGWVRERAEDAGVSTGRFGEWLYSYRTPLRWAVAVLTAIGLAASRPLSPGKVAVAALVSVIVLALLGLLQRPVSADTADTGATDDELRPASPPESP